MLEDQGRDGRTPPEENVTQTELIISALNSIQQKNLPFSLGFTKSPFTCNEERGI
jgi:hypothetical protein